MWATVSSSGTLGSVTGVSSSVKRWVGFRFYRQWPITLLWCSSGGEDLFGGDCFENGWKLVRSNPAPLTAKGAAPGIGSLHGLCN